MQAGLFQYQTKAEPVLVSAAGATALSWGPKDVARVAPKPRLSSAILAGAFFCVFVGVSDAAPTRSWEPEYPNAIDRAVVRAADQTPLFFDPKPEHTQGSDAKAVYPDSVRWPSIRAADHPFLNQSLQPEVTLPQAWEATYPDRPHRREVHPSQVPFAWSGSSVIPIGHVAWVPTYVDLVWRTVLPIGAVPTSASRTLPPFAAPDLSWQGAYPDRVVRLTLPTAQYPFRGVQPLDPIPNPPDLAGGGGGKDVIHLGTKESFGVTSDPTIGGWQPW